MYKIINGISPSQFIDKFSYISSGSRDGESCNLYTNNHMNGFYMLEPNAGIYYRIPFAKLNR